MLPASSSNNSSLLADYAKAPLDFGPASYRASAVVSGGVREVMMGPRSPLRGYAALAASGSGGGVVNGHERGHGAVNGIGKDNGKEGSSGSSTLDGSVVDPSSSGSSSSRTLVEATPAGSPARKGKEGRTPTKQTNPTGASGAEVDLRWPAQFAGLKRAGAGLENPSMACYANATLQVLLHTPPVLAKALAHSREGCEYMLSLVALERS
jgi:ubiquitin carboxyl-terminal hydrolase 36/42